MNRQLTGLVVILLLSCPAAAGDWLTEAQIRQVIDATDAAAARHDVDGIGAHLSNDFEKIIEFPHQDWMATVRLGKDEYLKLIGEGWRDIDAYDYGRDATVIHIMDNGTRGMSYSTVTEHVTRDGARMISKVREYAVYALEGGKPVITRISSHTLVGDTTPVASR